MIAKLDSALENDKMAGLGAGALGIATWVCLGFSLIPEAHTESAGALATFAIAFCMAALRRGANTRRKALPDAPSKTL